MEHQTGKFTIAYAESKASHLKFEKEALFIGRLKSSDIVLDNAAVSRVHAGINFLNSKYFLINLSSSNVLTLNGRLLGPKTTDVLSTGDIIQIGPFAIIVGHADDELGLTVQPQIAEGLTTSASSFVATESGSHKRIDSEMADVLQVFWEKRTRDKDDWGTRLRPTEKPQPGKAMINWKPTLDLQQPWRVGIFVWAFIILGTLGILAFIRYPQVYAGKPLASPHSEEIRNSSIAISAVGNSCTACHTPNEPIQNSCIGCHQASQFHASNTRAHEEAGISCTVCHVQHKGQDFKMTASAIQSCATCHNDANLKTYNGKSVRTAHGGSYGYPIEDGVWKWKGVYREAADAIPEINGSTTGDADDQARISRHFHSVHAARLKTPVGMKGDSRGLISCSSCHASFDPIDREMPRQTCGVCHTTQPGSEPRDARFAVGRANCISCHVQHPYSDGRWSEFLTEGALKRRKDAIEGQINQLRSQ